MLESRSQVDTSERDGSGAVVASGRQERVGSPVDLEATVEGILRSAGRPIHISDIRSSLLEKGIPIPGRGDEANVIVRLRRLEDRFTRTARGTYGLAEWKLPALAARQTAEEEKDLVTPEPITNTDVFLWALYELGGSDEFIDVEAAFYRAFELAPARLSWRTRSDLPDLKKCSKALRDAEGRKPALLVRRGRNKGG